MKTLQVQKGLAIASSLRGNPKVLVIVFFFSFSINLERREVENAYVTQKLYRKKFRS